MFKLLRKFRKSEAGAVSTDWVVLTAGVVGLAAASTLLINDGVESASANIGEAVAARDVGTTN